MRSWRFWVSAFLQVHPESDLGVWSDLIDQMNRADCGWLLDVPGTQIMIVQLKDAY